MIYRLFCVAVLVWLLPLAVRADGVVHVFATPGVFQGSPDGSSGGDQTFSSADGWNFHPTSYEGSVSFRFDQGNPNQFQHLDFAGPGADFTHGGVPLAVGDYPNSTAYPYNQIGGPSVGKAAVDFNGLAYVDTDFQVLDIAYDPATGLVTRFAANFAQRNNLNPALAIYGQIRYNSAVPLDTGKTYVQFEQTTSAASEADGGVLITVTRAGASDTAVSVDYATTASGTATANTEYAPVSGTLTWAAGDLTPRTFVLPILENALIDGSTTVDLQLTGDSVGLPAHTLVTITDDESLPPSLLHYRTFGVGSYGGDPDDVTASTAAGYTFSVISASGNSGAGVSATPIDFLSQGAGDYTVSFPFVNGRLKVGSYTSPTTHGGFAASGLTTELKPVSEDWQILQATYGGDGTLLQLAANYEALGTDGQPVLRGEVRYHSTVALRGAVTLAAESFQGTRTDAGIVVTVNRVGDASDAVSVRYGTRDYSAAAGVDYSAASGKLKWAAGDASPKTFTVPVLHAATSGNRVLFVNLSGDTLGAISTGTLTIVDDNLPPPSTLPLPDGRVDTHYPLYLANTAGVNLSVLAPQPDGSVYVGGNFYEVDGQVQPGIVRLDAQGSPDLTFRSPLAVNAISAVNVNAVAAQPDGKVLVAGEFGLAAGMPTTLHIVRLNVDGSRDANFSPDARIANIVYGVALQPDGSIVVAGSFLFGSGLARLKTDGSLDSSFAAPGIDHSIAYQFVRLQPDGRLLVGDSYGKITRLNSDGSVDNSFRPSLNASFGVASSAVLLQPDGKLVVPTGTEGNQITRFNHDGTVDTGFNPPLLSSGYTGFGSLALQPDGKLLVSLPYKSAGATGPIGIARLNPDGSLDTSFQLGADLPAVIGAIALEPDGGLLLSAGFLSLNEGVVHTVLARLSAVSPAAASTMVTVAADPAVVVKGGAQPGEIVITRTGDLSAPLTVVYTVKGNAVAGTDYVALTGHKKIKAGQSTAVVKIKPLPGALGRGTLRVTVILQASDAYTVGLAAAAKVKIVDDPRL